MNFRNAYKAVVVKILGLNHIRIEIIHKIDKTIVRPSDPFQAFLMGLGVSLPDVLLTVAQKMKEKKQMNEQEQAKKWGITQ